ncbi:MAG: 3-deoxy-manno-octulosonate cytidylyltransferase [Bacteroidota bacterium]
MKSLGIIPARFASTRFPGKPLVDIDGLSMIQRVYMRAQKAELLNVVVVATDDQRIFEHVQSFGGNVIMTSPDHNSGTERCGEVTNLLAETFDLVINIQGDEPFIHPQQIDTLIKLMEINKNLNIGTLATVITDSDSIFNPNHIKVALTPENTALYFSRSPIPFLRGIDKPEWIKNHTFYKHIGMYIFRAKVLKEITRLPEGQLEKAESLEQLRWMENGFKIGVEISDKYSPSVDTPEDLKEILNQIEKYK